MSIELRPLGVKCNIQCQYCYQNPQRDAGNVLHRYDINLMKSRIEREGGPFTLFGGEALLIPEEDLEELWRWGFEKYGVNGLQTNGVLINDAHVRMFKQYKVAVGISVDGPGELNDIRWNGTLEKTRSSTAKTIASIERLCREGIFPSLIVTLTRCNATRDKLPSMCDWMRHLAELGIAHVRLHILEVDHDEIRSKYSLSDEENIEALNIFYELQKTLTSLKFDLYDDIANMLQGQDNSATCIWTACDPYTTRAVRGIEGNGQSSNCGRTNKDGIDFTKASQAGFERYLALYHTPQEYGGCKGCRFFLMCKGQCPGTAIDGDWRNRTEHCKVWMHLFEQFEHDLLERSIVPISCSPKRNRIEHLILQSWEAGNNLYMHRAAEIIQNDQFGEVKSSPHIQFGHGDHGDGHGDHGDGHGDGHGDHGDGHGDHGDGHGDSHGDFPHEDAILTNNHRDHGDSSRQF